MCYDKALYLSRIKSSFLKIMRILFLKVCAILFGTRGHSQKIELTHQDRAMFQRSSIDCISIK